MKLWEAILRFFGFRDRASVSYYPSSLAFQALDADTIKERLRLASRGKWRGQRNEPRSDSTSWDEVEQEITNLIQNEHKSSIEQYLGQMKTYSARLGHLDLESIVTEIRNQTNSVLADFNVRAMEGLDYLQTLESELKSAKGDLNSFQQEHNRRRNASTKGMLWIAVSILFMLILFSGEIFFNGEMLGEGLTQGLSAGIAYAMGFSLINIILGAIAGHFAFRMKNHERLSISAWGWTCIFVWLGLIILFNLGVGHFRDALSGADWENAKTLAISSLVAHPFVLATFESYALWGFGMLISLLVALDVYAMDDPYPGYGNMTRTANHAVQNFIEGKDQIRQDLQAWRDDAKKNMEISHEKASRWKSDYATLTSSISAYRQALVAHIAHLVSVANRLLEFYRGENVKERTTPAPDHFSKPFEFTDATVPEVPTPKVLTEERVAELAQEATKLLEGAVETINSEYVGHMSRFVTITEVLATGT
ncbi:MAG TPA: hypothetical protein VMH86_01585 [Rhizomicrobium sp.]|nr:hypothetical protein [Rhizomicrobium sp.]